MKLRSGCRKSLSGNFVPSKVEKAKTRKHRVKKSKRDLNSRCEEIPKEVDSKKSETETKSQPNNLKLNYSSSKKCSRISSNPLITRDISDQFSDFSISIEKNAGVLKSISFEKKSIDLQSFAHGVQRSKNKHVVASTPLPLPFRKNDFLPLKTMESDLNGIYWSHNNTSRKNKPVSDTLSKSDPIKRTGRRKNISYSISCPNKSFLRSRRSHSNKIFVEKFSRILPSRNTPKKSAKKAQPKNGKDLVNSYLTLKMTSVRQKKISKDTLPQHSLLESKLYPKVSCYNPNATEVSLLNRKKKLFSNKSNVFTKSPADVKVKSILKSSRHKKIELKTSMAMNKEVALKLPKKYVVDKEKKKFSVKCDKEVSFQIGKSHMERFCNADGASNISKDVPVSLREAEEDIIIYGEDKIKMNIKSNHSGGWDGSYEAPDSNKDEIKCNSTTSICDLVSSKILHDIENQIPSDGRDKGVENVKGSKQNVVANSKTLSDVEYLPKQSVRKKKKLLHSKSFNVFDTECLESEGKTPKEMNVTCNQTIMLSVLQSMQ